MANELKITKEQVNAKVEIEDMMKVMRVYGDAGESKAMFIARYIHDMAKDIKPTQEELEKLAKIYKKNMERRLARRHTKNPMKTENWR